jgi:hypothetical protein
MKFCMVPCVCSEMETAGPRGQIDDAIFAYDLPAAGEKAGSVRFSTGSRLAPLIPGRGVC